MKAKIHNKLLKLNRPIKAKYGPQTKPHLILMALLKLTDPGRK